MIKYDWTACGVETTINAVFMHTDQTQMLGGTVKFSVDDVLCPNTNGVGTGGEGGVFNCGLSGYTFKLWCDPACTNELAIVELKLWKESLLNYAGSPYIMSGSTILGPWAASDLQKVFTTGSLWSPNHLESEVLRVDKGSAYLSAVSFAFNSEVILKTVIVLNQFCGQMSYRMGYTDEGTFDQDRYTGYDFTTLENGSQPCWYKRVPFPSITATDFSIWRQGYNTMSISKIIFLGEQTTCLDVVWTTPAQWNPVAFGSVQTYTGPSYIDCDSFAVYHTDLTIEFHDASGVQVGALPWVTLDTSTG